MMKGGLIPMDSSVHGCTKHHRCYPKVHLEDDQLELHGWLCCTLAVRQLFQCMSHMQLDAT